MRKVLATLCILATAVLIARSLLVHRAHDYLWLFPEAECRSECEPYLSGPVIGRVPCGESCDDEIAAMRFGCGESIVSDFRVELVDGETPN